MVRAANERSNAFYAGIFVWLVTCAWCARQGLGILAVVGSALLALWVFGLRDKFDSESSPSAYSVLNKGGQAILGGYTGEQLDAQLRGRSSGQTSLDSNKKKSDKDDAPLVTTATRQKPAPLNVNEKVKRRSAAAAAAERRLRRQQEE